MGLVELVFLFVLGIAVQLAVIAFAVHWGTAAIRRELLELRQDIVYLNGE